MRIRYRRGRFEYMRGRTWQPSRILRGCCRLGLHFMAWDFRLDSYHCECGRQYLLAEQIVCREAP